MLFFALWPRFSWRHLHEAGKKAAIKKGTSAKTCAARSQQVLLMYVTRQLANIEVGPKYFGNNLKSFQRRLQWLQLWSTMQQERGEKIGEIGGNLAKWIFSHCAFSFNFFFACSLALDEWEKARKTNAFCMWLRFRFCWPPRHRRRRPWRCRLCRNQYNSLLILACVFLEGRRLTPVDGSLQARTCVCVC